MKQAINTSNIPAQLQQAIDEYKAVGYTILRSVFTPQQIQLAIKELNYQTKGRGIDLFDPSTWLNIADMHDWIQGWAKWLYCCGPQVF